MARGLSDVLHHFDPALAKRPSTDFDGPSTDFDRPSAVSEPARPVTRIAVPVEPGDLLRTAIVWNLAVELRRAGGIPEAVFASDPGLGGEAATAGVGTSGAGRGPGALDAAVARATERARVADGAAIVLAALPPSDPAACADSQLLLVGPDPGSRARAVQSARARAAAHGAVPVGITIHGAHSLGEARACFETVARTLEAEGDAPVRSYGLLADDLAVYRSLVERRPVGFTRPQSLATRALADVARLLLEDLERES